MNHPIAAAPICAAAIYHIWPHYRSAVMRAMDASDVIEWTFVGSGAPFLGIAHANVEKVSRFRRARFRMCRGLIWQTVALRAAWSSRYDAIILLADPHFVTSWLAAPIARLRGKTVLFWGHGWRRPESRLKTAIRSLFYRLAHRTLLYAERGRSLGIEAGFPPERLTVVYNSLDLSAADDIIDRIECGELAGARPQSLFPDPSRPLVICTARITAACRFDILIAAAARLAQQGRPVNLLFVGEGPERERVAAAAKECGVDAVFFGTCYDEEILGQFIYHADLAISPGKIGLTAIHSLMYGTPAITHGNLDDQMPEVEAIEAGVTGSLFEQNDPASLADAISGWFAAGHDRATVRQDARANIAAKWNPGRQAEIIEAAVVSECDARGR